MKICCELKLEKELNYPNEELKGEVIINPLKNFLATKIILEIIGRSECSSLEKQSDIKIVNIFQSKKNIKSSQEFYNTTVILRDDGELTWVKNEKYIYPFSCVLPKNLPPTWKGCYGAITYTATVKIQEITNENFSCETKLLIGARRDLSLEEHLLKDAYESITSYFRTGLFKNEEIKLTLWLPLSGIATGQSLPMLSTIINKTNNTIDKIKFVLTKVENYGGSKRNSKKLAVRTDISNITKRVKVDQGKYEFYCTLKIPDFTLPTILLSNITTCQLFYEVSVYVTGFIKQFKSSKQFSMHTPGIRLVIGTSPISNWKPETVTQQVLKEMYYSTNPSAKEIIKLYDCIDGENFYECSTVCNIERQYWYNQIESDAED